MIGDVDSQYSHLTRYSLHGGMAGLSLSLSGSPARTKTLISQHLLLMPCSHFISLGQGFAAISNEVCRSTQKYHPNTTSAPPRQGVSFVKHFIYCRIVSRSSSLRFPRAKFTSPQVFIQPPSLSYRWILRVVPVWHCSKSP